MRNFVCRSNAHGGERVHCLAVGPDGLLYSGGSDKVGLGHCIACLLAFLEPPDVGGKGGGAVGQHYGLARCWLPCEGRIVRAATDRQLATLCTAPPRLRHSLPATPANHLAPSPPTPVPQLVRRWDPQLLVPAAGPLLCHHHSVRTLAAGGRELLVSGDKNGEVALWKV